MRGGGGGGGGGGREREREEDSKLVAPYLNVLVTAFLLPSASSLCTSSRRRSTSAE